jgi:ribokinase
MIDENGNNAINIFAGAAAKLKNEDIDKNLGTYKKIKGIFNSNGNSRLNNFLCSKKSK